ncbi:MAG: hypothetical protein ACI97A_002405, partial [Planctomycetota bacterium]
KLVRSSLTRPIKHESGVFGAKSWRPKPVSTLETVGALDYDRRSDRRSVFGLLQQAIWLQFHASIAPTENLN